MNAEPLSTHSWVFDLVAPDALVRGEALARNQAVIAARKNTRRVREWPRNPKPMTELASRFLSQDAATREAYAPFALLYLRWESQYPAEWDSPGSHNWSRWTLKEVILRSLARNGIPQGSQDQVVGLIIAAVQRPYRCKDWMYGQLVRHVQDTDALPDAEGNLRAEFIRHVARYPERNVKQNSWRLWLLARPEVQAGQQESRSRD